VTVRGKGIREGDIAEALQALEEAAEGVSFGSYPWFLPGDFGVHLVARSADVTALAKAGADLKALIRARGGEPEEVTDA
jgi:molybdopterin-biosynthesis enzyme MoeA-like protein